MMSYGGNAEFSDFWTGDIIRGEPSGVLDFSSNNLDMEFPGESYFPVIPLAGAKLSLPGSGLKSSPDNILKGSEPPEFQSSKLGKDCIKHKMIKY